MRNESDLEGLIDEYRTGLSEVDHWGQIAKKLVATHDWTEEGAAHLLRLVQDYGSFVLRNAAALAIAAGIEDGELRL